MVANMPAADYSLVSPGNFQMISGARRAGFENFKGGLYLA
jgi:hypothetical protein